MDEDLKVLPDTFRKAIKEDFIFDGKLQIGQIFYIQSHYSDLYEHYRVNWSFSMDNLLPWLKQGRVFVSKDDNPFSRQDKKKVAKKDIPLSKKTNIKLNLEL